MSSVRLSAHAHNYLGPVHLGLRCAGYFILAVALLVMVGWVMEIPSLTTLYPDFPSMKFNTALAFFIAGIGILIGRTPRGNTALRVIGGVLWLLMGASLLQYPMGISFGVDQLFWRDVYSSEFPGRPSRATCILFVLSGALMICAQKVTNPCLWFMHIALMAGIFISIAALVTYVLDARSVLSVQLFSSIAVHTAILFFILFLALAVLTHKKYLNITSNTLPGWRQINRLLLPVVVLPLILGMFLFHLVNAGVLTVALGFGIMITSFCMTAFAGLVWNTSLEDRWYQRLLKEIEVRQSMQKRLGTMMDSMPGGVLFLNQQGNIEDVNVGAADMLGYDQLELRGRSIVQLLPEDFRSRFWNVVAKAIDENKLRHFRNRAFRIHGRHKSGAVVVVLANIWPIDVEGNDKALGVFLFHGEMVERQLEALRREVRIDHLTAVSNKASLDARLQQLQLYGARAGEQVAIIMIDIDHFKVVNDRYGHPVGDQVLSEFAQRVSDSLRYSDALYRYGGEEFTVLVIGATERVLYELAERIRVRIASHPFVCVNDSLVITCSLGVAINDCRELFSDTLARADQCLYKAKKLGRNTTVMA